MTPRLAEYDPAWTERFEAEAEALRRALGDVVVQIEHVGATSVPGLAGKPTMDVAVGATTLELPPDAVARLTELGYEAVVDERRPWERRFRKGPAMPWEVIVHVVEWGGRPWNDFLRFRDALRADADRVREYERLKRELLDARGDWYGGEDKRSFVAGVLSRAPARRFVASASAEETEALARSLEGNDGVYFVPALTGLGSPHWDPYARGTIVGLTRGTGRAHLARAALEAIAYQTVDAVRAQEAASGERLESLKADGGGVTNRWLMQFQADLLGVPVIVPEIAQTTALGSAYLAGIATGVWTLEQVAAMWREADRYEPRMSEDERETLLAEWHRAVERSKGWATK